jgi:hypothetical protein
MLLLSRSGVFVRMLTISFPTSHRLVVQISFAGSFPQSVNYNPRKEFERRAYYLAADHGASLHHWLPSMNFRGGHPVHGQQLCCDNY